MQTRLRNSLLGRVLIGLVAAAIMPGLTTGSVLADDDTSVPTCCCGPTW